MGPGRLFERGPGVGESRHHRCFHIPHGAREKAATSVTAGIRMQFAQQLESSAFLDSAIIATARKVCRLNPEELRARHESEMSDTVELPISEDVLEAMRARLWDRPS